MPRKPNGNTRTLRAVLARKARRQNFEVRDEQDDRYQPGWSYREGYDAAMRAFVAQGWDAFQGWNEPDFFGVRRSDSTDGSRFLSGVVEAKRNIMGVL
jgi:hypothetical protein